MHQFADKFWRCPKCSGLVRQGLGQPDPLFCPAEDCNPEQMEDYPLEKHYLIPARWLEPESEET